MSHARRANPFPRPSRRTDGVTVGAILGALAVVAVLVIVLLLVWRPGAAPADPDAQPSGAAAVEEEADPGFGDDGTPEGAAEVDGADAEDLAAEGEDAAVADDEADAGVEDPAAEGEVPAEGDAAPADGEAPVAGEEDAPAEGEEAAPADGEEAPEEGAAAGADEDAAPAEGEAAPADGGGAPAPDEEAPADGEPAAVAGGEAPADGAEAAAEGEGPEADASVDVEREAEPAVRTDPTQRVAEVGETARATHDAVADAIEETESRLENLERATPDAEPPVFDLPEPQGDDGARVRDAGVEAGAMRDRLQTVASSVRAATRTTVEESAARVEVESPAPAPEDGPRVRAAQVASPASRDRLQAVSSALDGATRTTVEPTDARVEVSTQGDGEAATARIRTATIGGAGAVAPPRLPDPAATRAAGDDGAEGASVSLAADEGSRPATRLLDPTVPTLEDAVMRLARDTREALDVTTASPTEPAR